MSTDDWDFACHGCGYMPIYCECNKEEKMEERPFTVLGTLGPAGSGKDLTADYLVLKKDFVKVSFADPMKRFVRAAFNIDGERLWGPSGRRNEMFEVNDSWWFEVIGHFGMASKEICAKVLAQGTRTTGYMKLHDWLTQLRKTYPTQISARIILQTLGTEWGRAVDEIMWARYAHQIAQQLKTGKYFYHPVAGLQEKESEATEKYPPVAGVVIPDHRFKNEVAYTKAQGGYVIRLRRLAMEPTVSVGISGHQSEAEQKELADDVFDCVLEFPEGVDKAHEIIEAAVQAELWKTREAGIRMTLSHS